MKKKIITLVGIFFLTFLSGCGEKVTNEYGQKVCKVGSYIEISRVEGRAENGTGLTFITAYDSTSKIVYEILSSGSGCISIRPYLTYDENYHPVFQFYENGEIITKKNDVKNVNVFEYFK